jgi:hypothetical protein
MKKIILALALAAGVLVTAGASPASAIEQNGASKVDVCHNSSSGVQVINISDNAWPMHAENHGDVQVGSSAGLGLIIAPDCSIAELPNDAMTVATTTSCNMTNWSWLTEASNVQDGWTVTFSPDSGAVAKTVEQKSVIYTQTTTSPLGNVTSHIAGVFLFRPANCEPPPPATPPADVVYTTVTECAAGGWTYTVTATLNPALAEQMFMIQGGEYTAKWRTDTGLINTLVPGVEAYEIGRFVGAAQFRWVTAQSTVVAADGVTEVSPLGRIFVPRPADC